MAWNWYNDTTSPTVGNGGRATAPRSMKAQLLSKTEAQALLTAGANTDTTGVYLEVRDGQRYTQYLTGGQMQLKDYGMTWRFWRDNPEIELMQMTPWEVE